MTNDKSRSDTVWKIAIFLLYFAVTVGNGVRTPLFEAPDEHHHYFAAEVIATTGRLPTVDDAFPRQEAAQPPLYYLLGAALIAPLQLAPTDARENVWFNPYARAGDATSAYNINIFVHGAAENFPYKNYALAAHLLRLFSTVLGALTLSLIYRATLHVWRDPRLSLCALGLVAFLPQYAFVHSTISNDGLIIFLATATLYQLIKFDSNTKTRAALLLGLTIGAALLTKNQGVLLLGLACGSLGIIALRERKWVWGAKMCAGVAIPALLLVLPLWWRNYGLYGDLTATNQFVRLAGGDRQFSLWQVWDERRLLWTSLIGSFGWQNINPPTWVYRVWIAIFGAGVLGRIIGFRFVGATHGSPLQTEKSTIRAGVLFPTWFALVLAAWVLFSLQTSAAQGRLLFPALLSMVWFVVGGFGRIPRLAQTTILAALITTIYCSAWVIPRAYQRPLLLDTLPETAALVRKNMGDIELVAAYINPEPITVGDALEMTLFWQTDVVPTQSDPLEVEIIGRNQTTIGSETGYHGRGLYPPPLWDAGQLFADKFSLHLAPNLDAPTLARPFVKVGDSERLPVGIAKIVPDRWVDFRGEALAQIGDGIELMQVEIVQGDGVIEVELGWRVSADIYTEYTTFIHLIGDNGSIAQIDSPPRNGDYPTSFWRTGEQFTDPYTLLLPPEIEPGEYTLFLGMYDPQTLARQPVTVNGARQQDDMLAIKTITFGR